MTTMNELVDDKDNRISHLYLQVSLMEQRGMNPEYVRTRKLQLQTLMEEYEKDPTICLPNDIHDLPEQYSFLDPELGMIHNQEEG